MSPTVLRIGPYRFFFNSREETRRHVHVVASEGNAKFWLEPRVELAASHNLKSSALRTIEDLVKEHEDEFRSAWDEHFRESRH